METNTTNKQFICKFCVKKKLLYFMQFTVNFLIKITDNQYIGKAFSYASVESKHKILAQPYTGYKQKIR